MKKISVLLLLIVALTANSFADGNTTKDKDHDANEATYFVSNQFAINFPKAKNASWTVNKQIERADFILNDKKVTAFYGIDGEYLGLSQNVNFSLVPIEAQEEITKKYAGYKIAEVIEYETPVNNAKPQRFDGWEDTPIKFFVDLKNDQEEFLLKINRNGSIAYFKKIK